MIQCGDESKKNREREGKIEIGNCTAKKQQGCEMTLIHKWPIFTSEEKKKEKEKKDVILSLKIFIKLWPTGRSVSGNYHLLIYHVFHQTCFDGVKVQEPAIRSHKTQLHLYLSYSSLS